MLSLSVAMGIGRFAFTPILPLMLADGSVDLAGGSRLATANYLGHLVGAGFCALQPWLWSRMRSLPKWRYVTMVRVGLVATAVATLAAALPWPASWPALRLLAGATSAVVLVYTSGWCLGRLAGAGASALGGVVYAGPGVGIAASGVLGMAMAAAQWSAAAAWTMFAMLAFITTAIVWPVFRGGAERMAARPAPTAAPAAGSMQAQRRLLVAAYGLAGFGYIVTATYSPVIARAAGTDPRWVDAFWPLFGVGVTIGSLLATRIPMAGDRRRWLVGCHLAQASGIGVGLVWPTTAGFIAGSLLLGLPFTTITFLAMEEARRLQPRQAASLMGLLTLAYGIGQILGPPLVSWRLAQGSSTMAAFTWSLATAAAALVVAAVLYGAMIRRHPLAGGVRRAATPD
jgi:hypothetical protein